MMNTPRGIKFSNSRTQKPLKGIHPGNSNSLRSRSSLKVQSKIQFFEKKGSSDLPSFVSTSALPPLPQQPDRKRTFDDSFDAQSTDLKPCAKQICIQNCDMGTSRLRLPQTNPRCRNRLSDQICSVPRLPNIDRSAYQSQMNLINMFPVKKTVETQTSPKDSTQETDVVSRSSSLKDSSRYRRNSRTLLNSVTSSARRTLIRSPAQNRVALNSSPSVPNLPKMKSRKSLSKLFEGTKSSSKLTRIGKSLKNLTKRLGSQSSQSALLKSQINLNSVQLEESPSREEFDSYNSMRCVTIRRPHSKKFGFFISKNENEEVIVSEISPESHHLIGLLNTGDIIHTINGLYCKYLSLSEIYDSIIGKEEILLQTTSAHATGFYQ